ncbi:MAG TPA: TonB-dependent receptor [Pyrinomonadaceae bacterium]|nr:TonB-dependent receptor [Pyrinomonadaceae bacterium]
MKGRRIVSSATPHIIVALYRTEPKHTADNLPELQGGCDRGKVGWTGRVENSKNKGVGSARVSVLGVIEDAHQLVALATTVTDNTGQYTLCFIPMGTERRFVISATHEGYEDTSMLVPASNSPPDVIVLYGESFSEEGSLLETTEATRRHVFSPRLMEALPVSGLRNFDTFALLAPGVAPPPDTPNARGPGVSPDLGTAGQFSVNGLRSRENTFTVDGSDNNDEDIGTRRQGFVALATQSIESISEFQIITALGDARFGRNIGGQVNALTKSGSAEFHGSAYVFFTDNHLNARDFFDHDLGSGNLPASFALERQSDKEKVLLDGVPIVTPNPVGGENPLTRVQFGVAASGQIPKLVIPFFATVERLKLRASRESHFIVPTVEQRGMFDSGATGLLLPLPMPVPLYPASLSGDAVFSFYPLPNNPLGPYGLNTHTAILPADAKATRLSVKLEHQFGHSDLSKRRMPWSLPSNGDNLTARYNFSQETSIVPVTGEALSSSLRPNVRAKNIAFYLNRLLTRRISDVIRFSVGHTNLIFEEVRDPRLRASASFPDRPFLLNAPLLLNVTRPLGRPSFETPAVFGLHGISQTEQITGPLGQIVMAGFSPVGVDVNHFPQSRANTLVQIADTFTYAGPHGHIFTFGVDLRKTLINSAIDRNFAPVAVFGGLRTSSPVMNFFASSADGTPLTPQVFSGSTLAAAGLPVGFFHTLAVNPNSTIGIRFTQISLFAQEDWRVRPNLNINLGVRFNRLTRLSTKGRKLEDAFDLDKLNEQGQVGIEDCVRAGPAGIRPVCQSIVSAIVSAFPADFGTSFGGDKRDLDARTGVAWTINDRTVVRGGFGIYSGELPGIVVGESRNAFPNFVSLNVAGFPSTSSLARAEGIVPGTLNTLQATNAISYLTALARSSKVVGLDLMLPQKNLINPYSLQYAVTLERQLSDSYALSVAYVGTRGLKLLRISTPNLGANRSGFSPDPTLVVTAPFPQLTGGLATPQTFVPNTKLAISRTLFESSASSSYNSLQIELRKQYAHRYQFRTAFTYSHAIDDVSDFFDTAGAFALPQNSLVRSERASSNFDVRIRSVTHFVKDFTKDWFYFGGKRLGGWQLAGIVTAQTGQPFTVNSAFDTNRDGNLTDRLNTTAGLIRGDSSDAIQLRLAPGTNPLDLLASAGQDGSVGRNTFRAPSQVNFDLSITKFLNFNDRLKLQARTEIFNVFNRTNFGIPVRILESPAFGKSTYTTTPPRMIQFVIKVAF